jgi:hypothetical protein
MSISSGAGSKNRPRYSTYDATRVSLSMCIKPTEEMTERLRDEEIIEKPKEVKPK